MGVGERGNRESVRWGVGVGERGLTVALSCPV